MNSLKIQSVRIQVANFKNKIQNEIKMRQNPMKTKNIALYSIHIRRHFRRDIFVKVDQARDEQVNGREKQLM